MTIPFSIIAIIPAAGIGSRMRLMLPKQYAIIANKTVIEHTLSRLLIHPLINKIIVVLNEQDTFFQQLSISTDPRIVTTVGGVNRSDSVLAGLKLLSKMDWALIHDAARPCLSFSDLDNLIKTVLVNQQGAILAAPVSDTIKQIKPDTQFVAKTVDRHLLWQAMTPQLLPSELLTCCMKKIQAEKIAITDDASALEYFDYPVAIVEGKKSNIKITQQEDLALAEYYLLHHKETTCE